MRQGGGWVAVASTDGARTAWAAGARCMIAEAARESGTAHGYAQAPNGEDEPSETSSSRHVVPRAGLGTRVQVQVQVPADNIKLWLILAAFSNVLCST